MAFVSCPSIRFPRFSFGPGRSGFFMTQSFLSWKRISCLSTTASRPCIARRNLVFRGCELFLSLPSCIARYCHYLSFAWEFAVFSSFLNSPDLLKAEGRETLFASGIPRQNRRRSLPLKEETRTHDLLFFSCFLAECDGSFPVF